MYRVRGRRGRGGGYVRRSRVGKVGVEASCAGSGAGLEVRGSKRHCPVDPVGHCLVDLRLRLRLTNNDRHSLQAIE